MSSALAAQQAEDRGAGVPAAAPDEDGALVIRGLSKRFGEVAAVVDVDLEVRRGAFFGLVGPNGAGKTTLLSMAVGLLEPDAGSVRVLGADVWPAAGGEAAKRLLGVMPSGLALPGRLTGRELLTYVGGLRGLPGPVVRARTDELLSVLELGGAERTLIADYSTGMRKKIGLAVAVLHGPRVLVLDEPFEAIDPVSAAVVRAILDGFTATGGTVIMSSHAMALVEQLCDHVAVMAAGRILRSGTLSQVRGGHTLEEAFAQLVGAGTPGQGLSWYRC